MLSKRNVYNLSNDMIVAMRKLKLLIQLVGFSCLLLLFCCALPTNLNAQSASPSVFSNGGGSSTQFSYTIGEPLVLTLSSSSGTITQGFHQTYLEVVSVEESSINYEVSVYPNPTRNEVRFTFPALLESVNVTIYDTQGKLVHTQQIRSKEFIEMARFSRGLYTFIITHPLLSSPQHFSIIRS